MIRLFRDISDDIGYVYIFFELMNFVFFSFKFLNCFWNGMG